MLRVALELAFVGKVVLNGTTFTKWSKLKKTIREELIRSHKEAFTPLPGIEDPKSATTAELVDALCVVLEEDGDDVNELTVEQTAFESQTNEILEDVSTINGLGRFLEDLVLTSLNMLCSTW